MKKHLFIGLCALLSAVGCAESEIDNPIGGNGGTDDGSLSFTVGEMSRVSIANDLAWELNDRVGISVSGDGDNTNVEYKIAGIYDGSGALVAVGDELDVADPTSETFYAYYPYNADGESLSIDLTANCTTPLLRAEVANPADNKIALPFTHQYAKLVFNITAVEGISDLTGATATLVGANATATYDASTGQFSSEATGTITTDAVVDSSDTTLATVTMYVVPTTSISGASITISMSGEPIIVKEISTTEWNGNNEYPYNLTVGEVSYIDIPTSASSTTVDNVILKSDDDGSIARLLAQFRRCVATYQGNGSMQIKYLHDDDSTKYADGSDAVLPSATYDGETSAVNGMSSTDSDVMVYFPEYWYKYDADATESTYCRYYISDTEREGYVHVEESLVGAYHARMISQKLYSCVVNTATDNTTYDNFKAYAEARGTGYQLIDFEQHSTIAMMLFAKCETRNVSDELGIGTALVLADSGDFPSMGSSNSTGNKDSEVGGMGYVVGLGIEGVYGGFAEFVQGVTIDPNNLWTITDYKGENMRTVQAPTSSGFISRIACGYKTYADKYFDVVPTNKDGDAAPLFGCRYTYNATGAGDTPTNLTLPMYRAYSPNASYGGIVAAGAQAASNTVGGTGYSTRLAFRGTITVVE